MPRAAARNKGIFISAGPLSVGFDASAPSLPVCPARKKQPPPTAGQLPVPSLGSALKPVSRHWSYNSCWNDSGGGPLVDRSENLSNSRSSRRFLHLTLEFRN